jgi:hypothetical protein
VSGHLTADEQVDVLDGSLTGEQAAHLQMCAACREESAQLRAIADQARQVSAPEPSPLFWEHQAARISALVAAEAPSRGRSRWRFAAWSGGLAAALAALLLFVGPASSPSPRHAPAGLPSHAEFSAGTAIRDSNLQDEPSDERAWSLVEELGGQIDRDAAAAALLPAEGAADSAVDDLDADEQAALVRVLQSEMKRKSG